MPFRRAGPRIACGGGALRVLLVAASLHAPLAAAQERGLSSRPVAEDGPARVRAVLVGVSDFKELGPGDDLRYAGADAEEVARSLQALLGPSLRSQDLHLLVDREADLLNVRQALVDVLSGAGPEDVVVLYFATHGVASRGEGYLLTWDTNVRTLLPYSSLPLQELNGLVRRSRARHVLVLTDACHSGLAGNDLTEEATLEASGLLGEVTDAPTPVFLLASAKSYQQSVEGAEYCGGHGAYTCVLLEALDGAADTDRDGRITLGELGAWVPHEVYRRTDHRQLPEPSGTYDTELVLVASPGQGRWWADGVAVDPASPAAVAARGLDEPVRRAGTALHRFSFGVLAGAGLAQTLDYRCTDADLDGGLSAEECDADTGGLVWPAAFGVGARYAAGRSVRLGARLQGTSVPTSTAVADPDSFDFVADSSGGDRTTFAGGALDAEFDFLPTRLAPYVSLSASYSLGFGPEVAYAGERWDPGSESSGGVALGFGLGWDASAKWRWDLETSARLPLSGDLYHPYLGVRLGLWRTP